MHTLKKEELGRDVERDVLLRKQQCEYEFGPCVEGSPGFGALWSSFLRLTSDDWDPKPRTDPYGLVVPVSPLWDTL